MLTDNYPRAELSHTPTPLDSLNNLSDKQPPLLTQTSQYGVTGVNTAPEAYDTIGRQWYVTLSYRTD